MTHATVAAMTFVRGELSSRRRNRQTALGEEYLIVGNASLFNDLKTTKAWNFQGAVSLTTDKFIASN